MFRLKNKTCDCDFFRRPFVLCEVSFLNVRRTKPVVKYRFLPC